MLPVKNAPLKFMSRWIRKAGLNNSMPQLKEAEQNPESPIHTLTGEETLRYLCRLAEDPSAPAAVLEQLARHPSATVREAASDNPHLTPECMSLLAQDSSADVRYAMAENHNLSQEVLLQLATDENPYVSCRAQATLARLQASNCFAQNAPFDIESLLHVRHARLQFS
ncbi:MAG: hypothetical protein K2X27_14870 [Candidatus Obscuribacterales bacterium]|nr:hypothetical protein [Candidatus Obscuribacterales bacterium]